jgi:hypothetical protein
MKPVILIFIWDDFKIEEILDIYRNSDCDIIFLTFVASWKSKLKEISDIVSIEVIPQIEDVGDINKLGSCFGETRGDIIKIWQDIVNDHQTWELMDRDLSFPEIFMSNPLKNALVLNLVIRSHECLERLKPDMILSPLIPPSISSWVFMHVAQVMGVRIRFMTFTLLPWRFALVENISRSPELIPPKNEELFQKEYECILKYNNLKCGGHEMASPSYMKNMLRKNKGKIFSFSNDFRRFWRRPDLLLNKVMCYRVYHALAHPPVNDEKFVILFLHYQPEASTLPNAFGFSQQFSAVVSLASTLPKGYKLYVKEHPSIFATVCTWKVRLPFWYRMIAQLPNVCLIPMGMDAYHLIDKSACVASINGTVLGEALWRGKPAIAFAPELARFADTKLLHKYKDLEGLSWFLSHLEKLEGIAYSCNDYYDSIREKTYSVLEDNIDSSNFDHSKMQKDAYIKICNDVIDL